MTQKNCNDCKFNKRGYADGYIMKDWTVFTGEPLSLPEKPDTTKFWTWQSCNKSTQKVQYYNIDGKCNLFARN